MGLLSPTLSSKGGEGEPLDFEVDTTVPGRRVGVMMVENEQHHKAILHSVRSFKAQFTTSG